jgi:hypothetical protein
MKNKRIKQAIFNRKETKQNKIKMKKRKLTMKI